MEVSCSLADEEGAMQVENGNVRRAWEAFVEGRHIHPDLKGVDQPNLRNVVIESWKRSSHHGIDLGMKDAPLLEEAELFRRRIENNIFMHASQRVLKSSRKFLLEAGAMMIMTDPSGVIIETEGDLKTIDSGREIHAERGGCWGETEVGTNGIGTAIALGQPVQIKGAEHFCPEFQSWTCAGSVVRHPGDGDVMGVIVIAGLTENYNPQSLALAVVASQQVTAEVAYAVKHEHQSLLQYFLSKRKRWPNEDVVMVDKRGIIVHATERALLDINRQNAGLISQGAIAALKSLPFSSWRSQLNTILPDASVELVEEEGVGTGAFLVLRGGRRQSMATKTAQQHTEKGVDLSGILGESPVIKAAKERVAQIAENGAPILLTGETGVGKELFARAIHGLSSVSSGPFVPVNCGGLPRELMASELFGYAKGAFTGAREEGHIGKVEAANNGILCLDEIGELPLELQPFLLRVLEGGVVYRVGSNEPRPVDVRLVAMTNRNLREEVDARRFRDDLYYRIAALQLPIPALREREDDILLLAEHFLKDAAERLGRSVGAFSAETRAALLSYPWPGNIRELRNSVEYMLTISSAKIIDVCDLPLDIQRHVTNGETIPPHAPVVVGQSMKSVERANIEAAVRSCGGNLTRAAKQLGIARSTLYLRLAEYGAPCAKDMHHGRPVRRADNYMFDV